MAQRFTGTIASFNATKGWGYIHTPELFEAYGKDVFLHKDYVTTELNVGDVVDFDIEQRPDGKPQARNICPAGQTPIPSPQMAARLGHPQAAAMGQRFHGTIVSFNDKKGWGYINSPELLAKFGKDVFLHRDYIEPGFAAAIGESVEFSIELRASDGMPQARGIRRQGAHPQPVQQRAPRPQQFAPRPQQLAPRPQQLAPMPRRQAPAMAPRMAPRMAPVMAMPRLQTPFMANPMKRPVSNSQSGKYTGSVVSFNEKKGWGYIHCAQIFNQFGKDVFLHRDYLPPGFIPQVGSELSFTTELRGDGKPQARDISAPADTTRCTGTVVSFNPAKGWGYINSPELLEAYGKDVFLHRDYCEPGFLANAGDVLEFCIEIRAKDGMPQAREVRTMKKRRM